MGRIDYTGLLYAQPSAEVGVGRTLDIGCTFDTYNYSTSGAEADSVALASDWCAVGAGLRRSISCMAATAAGRLLHGRRSSSR